MDDIKAILKQYWPYIVGIVVGLYLILRYSAGGSSGGSSGSSGGSDYAAYMQAQTAAGQQNAALQIQSQMASDKNALDSRALDAQIAINLAGLEVQKAKNYSDAFNTFQGTQAAMAEAIGGSAAAVLDALNKPAITAMQAGAVENMAAMEAAGNVASQSLLAQGGVVSSSAQTAGQISQGIGSALSMISNIGKKEKTDYAGIINAGANAYSTYMTGGLMNQNQSTLGGYGFGTSVSPYYNPGGTQWGGM